MAKQKFDYDLIVIGSGGGGSVAAHIAAAADKKVAVAEVADIGGECPNWGCVPTKALLHAAEIYDSAKHAGQFGIRSAGLSYNYPSIKAWKDLAVQRTGTGQDKHSFEKDGIKILTGEAKFVDPHTIMVNRRHYTAENFLIATGARSFIPPIDGLEEAGYITFKEATQLSRPPKSLFIIGAGSAGCEFAHLFSIFGSKVYLSDIAPRPLVSEDEEVGELLREVFETERGMEVLTNSKVTKVAKDGLTKRVFVQQGAEIRSIKVDEILVTTGKQANVELDLENAGVDYTPRGIKTNEFMQTSARHIYAAGDVVGPYLYVHVAIYQSKLAVNNMLHKQKIAGDYHAIPRCVFVAPEVASVGLSEDECVKRDLRIKKALAPISITARSNITNTDYGFVKVITSQDHTLLGATIVGPHAGEMIHELTLAVQHNMSAAAVANTIHAFPTWSEAVRVACSKVMQQ
ncbi:MAG TPA: NAD(P)/FAD-dependent oxidoreductase [Candidatus Acidoferrum sp.]|nr:NAD(P)/FAD-dependent oxidoreductase [Candidatus Acidoferrum sp.]